MTLLYRKGAPGHHCRPLGEEVVLATNGDQKRILHHERVHGKRIKFPLVNRTEQSRENKLILASFGLFSPI